MKKTRITISAVAYDAILAAGSDRCFNQPQSFADVIINRMSPRAAITH